MVLKAIKNSLVRFLHWEYSSIVFITAIVLILHLIIINNPNSLIYDENYYIAEARSVLAGEGTISPHPPLAKAFITLGLVIFGDNVFGWRFFSLIFGTCSVVLFYFICRKLDISKSGSTIGTLFFAFDNLNFVQSSIAMLDVFLVFFMLLSFLLYLHRRSLSSGIFLGTSALCKLTGASGYFTVAIDWLLDRKRKYRTIVIYSIAAIISFLIIYIALSYALFGFHINIFSMSEFIFTNGTTLTFANAVQRGSSYPWDWLLQPMSLFYNFNPQYIAMLSLTTWVLAFVVLSYFVYGTVKHDKACQFGLAWYTGLIIPMVLLVLVTNRITFIYYYFPMIGAICLGAGIISAKLLNYWRTNPQTRLGNMALGSVYILLILHIVIFILFSPIAVPFIKWLPIG
jgi:dolichyl-phosphate-mannose-protein mannosyltransferase